LLGLNIIDKKNELIEITSQFLLYVSGYNLKINVSLVSQSCNILMHIIMKKTLTRGYALYFFIHS